MAGAVPAANAERLARAAQSELAGCSRVVIFDAANAVLHTTAKGITKADMQMLAAAVTGPREQAIRGGLCFEGKRYEVHQHHPPLAYGRCMLGDPEVSPGGAVCQGEIGGAPVYVAITYELPATSARMVAVLSEFCQKHCPAQ